MQDGTLNRVGFNAILCQFDARICDGCSWTPGNVYQALAGEQSHGPVRGSD